MDAIRTVGDLKQALEEFPDDWDILILIPGEAQSPEEIIDRGFRTDLRRSEEWEIDVVRQEHIDLPRAQLRASRQHRESVSLEQTLHTMNLILKYPHYLARGSEEMVIVQLAGMIQAGTLVSKEQIPAEYDRVRQMFTYVLKRR